MSHRRSSMCDWKLGVWGAAILAVVVGALLVGSSTAGEDKTEPTPSSAAPAPSVGSQENIQEPAPSSSVPPPSVGPQEGDTGPGPSSDSPTPQGGPQEGIKVHGHWIIDIRDPDGTLVTRREFENSLESSHGLPLVLARLKTVGVWSIGLSGSSPPCTNAGNQVDCQIEETVSTVFANDTNVFKTLTLSVPTSGSNVGKLVLSGSAIALKGKELGTTASITLVSTSNARCEPTIPPASNCGTGRILFTSSTMSPVSVSAGQQIQVTVIIGFTSGS